MPRIDRSTAIYGLVLAGGGGLFVLLFWVMAAINLHRGFGLIAELGLSGFWYTLFWMYPFLLFIALFGALAAFLANANEAAVGAAGLPIAGIVLYYLALVTFY